MLPLVPALMSSAAPKVDPNDDQASAKFLRQMIEDSNNPRKKRSPFVTESTENLSPLRVKQSVEKRF